MNKIRFYIISVFIFLAFVALGSYSYFKLEDIGKAIGLGIFLLIFVAYTIFRNQFNKLQTRKRLNNEEAISPIVIQNTSIENNIEISEDFGSPEALATSANTPNVPANKVVMNPNLLETDTATSGGASILIEPIMATFFLTVPWIIAGRPEPGLWPLIWLTLILSISYGIKIFVTSIIGIFFSVGTDRKFYFFSFFLLVVPLAFYFSSLFFVVIEKTRVSKSCKHLKKLSPYLYSYLDEIDPSYLMAKGVLKPQFQRYCQNTTGCPFSELKIKNNNLLNSNNDQIWLRSYDQKHDSEYNKKSMYGKGPDYRRKLEAWTLFHLDGGYKYNCRETIESINYTLNYRYSSPNSIVILNELETPGLKKILPSSITKLIADKYKISSKSQDSKTVTQLGTLVKHNDKEIYLWTDNDAIKFLSSLNLDIKNKKEAKDLLEVFFEIRNYAPLHGAKDLFDNIASQTQSKTTFKGLWKTLSDDQKTTVQMDGQSSESFYTVNEGFFVNVSAAIDGWRFIVSNLSYAINECYSRDTIFISQKGHVEVNETEFLFCAS